MKKLLLFVSILSAVLTSCGGDSDSEALIAVPPGCSVSVTSFTAQQNADKIIFNISALPGALYYEASICPTGMCSGPDGATTIPLDVQTNSISIAGYPYTGDMVVHLRSVCPDNSRSAWVGPTIVSVQEYCGTPDNLHFFGNEFSWNYGMSLPQASNYQVQYGPQGFSLGSGTTATVNYARFDDASMAAGQTYDFYVRAYCVNGLGYGNWAGPYTHLATTNHNMCLAPVNIVADIDNSNSVNYKFVTFSWNGNGENSFEYTVIAEGNTLANGVIETTSQSSSGLYNLARFTNYTFYVRAICDNGARTPWVTKDINL